MKPPVVPVETSPAFRARHPFVLSDGRRFASLYCAAKTALFDTQFPVVHHFSKVVYEKSELIDATFGPLPDTGHRDMVEVSSAFRSGVIVGSRITGVY